MDLLRKIGVVCQVFLDELELRHLRGESESILGVFHRGQEVFVTFSLPSETVSITRGTGSQIYLTRLMIGGKITYIRDYIRNVYLVM